MLQNLFKAIFDALFLIGRYGLNSLDRCQYDLSLYFLINHEREMLCDLKIFTTHLTWISQRNLQFYLQNLLYQFND